MGALFGNYNIDNSEDIFCLLERLPAVNQRLELRINDLLSIGMTMVDTVNMAMVVASSLQSPNIIKLQLDYMTERGTHVCEDYYNYKYSGVAGNYLRAYRHMMNWGLAYNFVMDFCNFPLAMVSVIVVEDRFILCVPDSGIARTFSHFLTEIVSENCGYMIYETLGTPSITEIQSIGESLEQSMGIVMAKMLGLSQPLQIESYYKLNQLYQYQQKMIAEKKDKRKASTQEKKEAKQERIAKKQSRTSASYRILNK